MSHRDTVGVTGDRKYKTSIEKSYHIETFDGGAYLNFFTTAKSKKEALKNLLNNSHDLNNLTNENKDWVIKIKTLK